MATMEDALDTYTHLPLHLDPSTKSISSSSSDTNLQTLLTQLNSLHRDLLTLETKDNVPPPPMPVNPKRSANINKLRESAAAATKKGSYDDTTRLLGVAIDMALARPGWEPVGLAREELAGLYAQRANAHINAQRWVEGWKDCELSINCKSGVQTTPQGQMPGNPRGFAMGGKCLCEMGRWVEAVGWLGRGLDAEGPEGEDGGEMVRLLGVARGHLPDD